jgi:oligoribonuclease
LTLALSSGADDAAASARSGADDAAASAPSGGGAAASARSGGDGRPRLGTVLAWMDLEMTGLEPSRDVIVEIATLITDDELQILAEGPDLVVHQPEELLAQMDPFVVGMHTRSGLLDAVRASTVSLEQAGEATLAFLKEHVTQPGTVPLCGNSIGTDRRFLAAYLPDIENFLHYRSVDVSSVKELVRRWYPAIRSQRPRKVGSHRALDDIRESVAELRYYREHVFVPVPLDPPAAVAGDSAVAPPTVVAGAPADPAAAGTGPEVGA